MKAEQLVKESKKKLEKIKIEYAERGAKNKKSKQEKNQTDKA